MLWLEMMVLFAGIPALTLLGRPPAPVFLLLWPAAAATLWFLHCDRTFDRSQLWNAAALKPGLHGVLLRFALGTVGLSLAVLLLAPGLWLNFVRQRPIIWAAVMVLYPALSVYPQELIYRTFFFHRYGRLIGSSRVLILVNALAFGWLHVLFRNELAVVLTVVGGFVFAHTYHKTRSTLLVSIEHALYGALIFTIGLGMYFYHGAVR